MENLNVKLMVGYPVKGVYTRDVQLLRSNAITEEIATRKSPTHPYTWIATIITIFCAKIGDVEVAEKARKTYLETGEVIIPQVVKEMPLADANSLLLEIHRKCWQNLIPSQSIFCSSCTKPLIVDVDLNKIQAPEKGIAAIEENQEITALFCDLDYPIDFSPLVKAIQRKNLEQEEDAELKEAASSLYNRVNFKVPRLLEAIKNEEHVGRNIEFWRRVALDCMTNVISVSTPPIDETDNDEEVIHNEFPIVKLRALGLKLFMYFDGADLKKIRDTMISELPVMPFFYEDTCPCDARRKINFVMEATNFFSE